MLIHAPGHYHGGRFRTLNRLLHTDRFVPGLIAFNLLLAACVLCAPPAHAATSVEVVPLVASDHYEVERVYGGEIRAHRASTLGFRHSGSVHAMHADEGDSVAAGALLAELDPEPLEAQLEQARARVAHAEASLEVAHAALELARDTKQRFEDLLAKGHTSAQQFDEVRLDLTGRQAQTRVADATLRQARASLHAAEVDLDRSRIFAPFAGRVQARMVDEGTIVMPGQAALRLIESGQTEARIGLPTDVAMGLDPGARFVFDAGSLELEGTLMQVLPEVDAETRTVTALFALGDSGAPIGSLIELRLLRHVTAPGFWVPITALSEAQRGLWSVYVLQAAEGGFVTERRLVEVIHTRADTVFVRGTLRDGEQVVSTGTQRIVPGQIVTAVAAR